MPAFPPALYFLSYSLPESFITHVLLDAEVEEVEMWAFTSLITYFLVAVASVRAASDILTAPACGLRCIQLSTLASTCSPANITCICTNDALKAQITACAVQNCTIIEQLQTEKFSFTTCGITGEDRTALVWHLGVAFGVLGLVAYGLRCIERLRSSGSWGMDDWVISMVVCILIPMCVFTIPLSRHGLGLDMWNVPSDDISTVLYYFYLEEIFYAVSLPLLKISVLFFYLRVFPQQWIRVCCFVLIALHIGYATAYGLAVTLQCSPINGAWLSWSGEYDAKCVGINLLGWSGAAVNILLDLTTIFLPVPELIRLTMSLRKKILVLLMFTVGLFVTFVSIIRLRSLIEFGASTNITQDYVEVGYWSTIEVSVGVVCVCMPAVRALFSHGLPMIFSFGSQRDRSGYESNNSNGSRGINSRPKAGNGSTTSTDPRAQREWSANQSDVELVSVEKMRTDAPDERAAPRMVPPAKTANQWSSESGFELPMQGRATPSVTKSDQWSYSTELGLPRQGTKGSM